MTLDPEVIAHDLDECDVNQEDEEQESVSVSSSVAPFPSGSDGDSLDSTAEDQNHNRVHPMTGMLTLFLK